MKRRHSLPRYVLLLIGLMAVAANAKAEAVDLTDCPEAVQKTLGHESEGGEFIEILKIDQDGQTRYARGVSAFGRLVARCN